MAHDREQLNALIFHNPVMLPRTSPAYAEMTLAVAELQGNNYAKAALYAEAALIKHPTLAAALVAKTAADVFEATPDNLLQERALFCLEEALKYAPTCQREIIDFFVGNILGHYVEVLCTGALAELAEWQEHESYAAELEDRALSLDGEAAHRRGSAALLGAAGFVTGLVALFSRRLGTQVFSGIASVAAFSESVRLSQDAMILEGMAAELRMAGYAQRLQGQSHRAASLRYLVPARDLIGSGARLLQAVGLPPQSLDRLIYTFTNSFRHVLGAHLHQLSLEIGLPMSEAIGGKARPLAATYGHLAGPIPVNASLPDRIAYGKRSDALDKAAAVTLYTELNPAAQETVLWLEQMLPGVRGLEAYHLLGWPMPTIAHNVFGFRQGTRSKSLTDRMEAADKTTGTAGGCLVLLTLVCLFIPPVFLLPGALAVGCMVVTRRRIRARNRVRAVFNTLWSVDTWLTRPPAPAPGRSGAVAANGQPGPPPLPFAGQGGQPGAKARLSPFNIILIVCGSVVGLFLFSGFIGALLEATGYIPPAKKSGASQATTPAQDTRTAKPTPGVRRAVPVEGSVAPSSSPTESRSASNLGEESYAVTGVASSDTLNVRAGPGANTNIVAKLPNGMAHIRVTGARVLNGTTEWVPIRVGDRTGWVTRQHLQRE